MWNFESGKPFGRKVHFLTPLGQQKFPGVSIVLNYASTSNIREVKKFYNLSDKTFEADFKFDLI